MDFWRIFRIFFWKNGLFLLNNYKQLATIFTGCYFILLLYLYTTNKEVTLEQSVMSIRDSFDLVDDYPKSEGDVLFYSPSFVPQIDALIENLRIKFQMPPESVQAVNGTSEMIALVEHGCRGNCFAVSFENFPKDTNGILRYSISSNTMRLSPKKHYINDEEFVSTKGDDEYLRYGYLSLQHWIDRLYIESLPSYMKYTLRIDAMPSESMLITDSQRVIMFGSLYSILFNVLLLSTFLVPLVEEKQNGLKEFLVVATPLNFLNGATFFLIRFVLYFIFLIASVTLAFVLKAQGTIAFLHMLLLMIFYTLSAMSYTYLLSVCFNSVFYAKVGGLLLLIIPYIFRFDNGGFSSAASVFFSTKTFMDGIEIFQIFTLKHHEFGIRDLTRNVTDGSFNILSIYSFFILQCLIYALLYNYLSCVFPGPGGLKKPYLFFLKSSFYKKRQRNEYTTSERGSDAIIIQDLVKTFKSPTRKIQIADRLNMVIKNKQITVLLGHNGVGKTTTMNMIMGSVPKDSGKIIVCSERDVASYRHLIGFCPQHSVFMEYMTCGQHLRFFAELRGMTAKEANAEATHLLQNLKLQDKRDEYGKNLSGGMKRRLSLGIALAGQTKVVILDEPSSGLDIQSRRVLWDILLELRKTKAILITTHHMEEAEVLGDTICILSNGRVLRSGSPLELKRKTDCGYILKLCTNPQRYEEQETLNQIKKYVPNARILNIVPPTIHITLPYESEANYKNMLLELEGKTETLGIENISITDTSMEDVFLNCESKITVVGQDEVDGQKIARQKSTFVPYEPLSPSTQISFSRQFRAIFYKKFIFLRREWKFSLLMFSLPILSFLLAILLMNFTISENTNHVLPLNLNIVKEGRVYLLNSAEQSQQAANFEKILKKNIERSGIAVENLQLQSGEFLESKIIDLQGQDLADFLQNVIGVIELGIGEDMGELTATVLYSRNIYHSSVALTNLVDSSVLEATTSENEKIDANYLPVQRFISDISPSRLEYFAVIVPIGMFFYMFYYISLPFQECETGFKSLQAVPVLRYWFSTFAFDLMQHFFLCFILFFLHLLPAIIYSRYEVLLIVMSLFFYGVSYFPILYIFANSFRSISTISTYLLSLLIVSAIVPLITSVNAQSMSFYQTTITLMRILPDFNLNHQLRVINENYILQHRKTKSHENPEELASFSSMIFYCAGIFLFVSLVFISILENKNKLQKVSELFACYKCRRIDSDPQSIQGEEDILVKRQRKCESVVNQKEESTYPLYVAKLYKFFNGKAVVRDLNFAVENKECFGLLGVNGAGKTTTFQMITSIITLTGGTIKINGIDICRNETEYRYHFGYCPQYDCLNNFMTASEILNYMGKLRNVQSSVLNDEVNYWLDKLDLTKYARIPIRHYSGGTKRKINAAMAMIGSPSLVLLDEPTTGVDPVSRRFLWKCIKDFQKRGKTVVLTSHSMDECEHLCNRLAIMAEGSFKCIGAVPELKRDFGSGFTIKIKIFEHSSQSPQHIEEITNYVREKFPNCTLRENHAGMLTYFVKNENHIVWSEVFDNTEVIRSKCQDLIENYSINESTLEDIFLKFDKRHKGEETPSNSSVEEV